MPQWTVTALVNKVNGDLQKPEHIFIPVATLCATMALMFRSISDWGQAEMNAIRAWNSGIMFLALQMPDLKNGSSKSKD